jgi:hypothetical protein
MIEALPVVSGGRAACPALPGADSMAWLHAGAAGSCSGQAYRICFTAIHALALNATIMQSK